MDWLRDFEEINELLDIYENLLTPYQSEIMSLYYRENFSLSEIANQKAISRNAVSILIKRVNKILDDYEMKLKLKNKRMKIVELMGSNQKVLQQILEILDQEEEKQ